MGPGLNCTDGSSPSFFLLGLTYRNRIRVSCSVSYATFPSKEEMRNSLYFLLRKQASIHQGVWNSSQPGNIATPVEPEDPKPRDRAFLSGAWLGNKIAGHDIWSRISCTIVFCK